MSSKGSHRVVRDVVVDEEEGAVVRDNRGQSLQRSAAAKGLSSLPVTNGPAVVSVYAAEQQTVTVNYHF